MKLQKLIAGFGLTLFSTGLFAQNTADYLKKGDLFFKFNVQKAKTEYLKAADIKETKNVLQRLGKAYAQTSKYDSALICFEKAVNKAPHDANLYNDIGVTYYNKSNKDLALINFFSAYLLDSNDKVIKTNLESLWADFEFPKNNLEHFVTMLKHNFLEEYSNVLPDVTWTGGDYSNSRKNYLSTMQIALEKTLKE